MAFFEGYLPLDIIPQIQIDYIFKSIVLENSQTDFETIQPEIIEPQIRLALPDLILNQAQYLDLLSFFEDRSGDLEGFRFTLPFDCILTKDEKLCDLPNTTTKAKQQGLALSITSTEYQIVKKYSIDNTCNYKTIKKIRPGCQVYINNILQTSGFSVDLNTGRIVFNTPPTGLVTISCEFDLPVRFNQNSLEATQIAKDGDTIFYQISKLSLLEIIEEKVFF